MRPINFQCTDFIRDQKFWTDLLEKGTIKWFAYGDETCPDSGRLHFQMFFGLPNQRSFKSVIALVAPRHIEILRGRIDQNKVYCSKESELIKFGDIPQYNEQNGNDERKRHAHALKLAREGKMIELMEQYPILFTRYYRTYEALASRYAPMPPRLHPDQLTCYWIYGESRTGKSKSVWDHFENDPRGFYPKPANNKWWPSYRGEKVVYLDDFPIDGKYMAHYIKTWFDVMPFHAEIKGTSQWCRPEVLIVTCNASIDEVFGDLPKDCAAIKERFVEFEKIKGQNILF